MNASPQLDPNTLGAIRQGLAAAAMGRLGDACAIGERALANGGDQAALNAMLGMLRCQSGDLPAGIGHLRAAYAARNGDPVILTNLATALAESGDYQAAFDLLPEDRAAADPSLRLERLRGFCAQMIEHFEDAIASYERVVAAEPQDWEAWNNLGNARGCAGDHLGSEQALRQAVKLNPDSIPARINLAQAVGELGTWDETERMLREVAEEFPDDTVALLQLHALLRDQGKDDEAAEPMQEAVLRAPGDPDLLVGLASHQVRLLDYSAAEESYRKASRIDPTHPVASLGLASVFDLTNRTDELAAHVGEAEALGVREDALNFIRAMDHRRAKRFDQGLRALEQVPEELETPRRIHLMGQLLDGAGRYDEAFETFTRMNELALADPSDPAGRAAVYRSGVKAQSDSLSAEWMARWRRDARHDGRPSPAFLLGFPRSGTTLLDTMLMGSPQLEVLEEEPALREANLLMPEFDEFPALDDERLQAARDAYFGKVATLTPMRPGSLLIDKNPLATNMLPLIGRLFPDARIILALRHPCDVVLSCFITNFRLNDGMSNFLQLETAAELYDLTFTYFERAQALLNLPVHRVVYEDMLEDQERELRPLFDFLDVEWNPDVLDHQATARNRGRIKTASYAQVVEPIYKRSAGRWRNYRKQLEPILPVLEPWVEKFGYSL